MPTYYEVLKLEPNATVDQIEAAIDSYYNQYRFMVNSPEADVVEKANRALRDLETIRSTLTAPERRAVYDQSLSFGGLMDLSASVATPALVSSGMAPVSPQKSSKKESPTPKNAWECDSCDTVNSRDTVYCISCGNQVGKNCPECGHTLPMIAEFCTKCGVNFQQREWEIEQERIAAEKAVQKQVQNYFQYVRTIPMHRHKKIREALETHPEYAQSKEAISLYQAVEETGSKWTWTLIGIAAAISAVVGLVVGITGYHTRLDTLFGAVLGGAVLGAIGAAIFGNRWAGKWGGESGQTIDVVLAVLTGPFILIFGIFVLVIFVFLAYLSGG